MAVRPLLHRRNGASQRVTSRGGSLSVCGHRAGGRLESGHVLTVFQRFSHAPWPFVLHHRCKFWGGEFAMHENYDLQLLMELV